MRTPSDHLGSEAEVVLAEAIEAVDLRLVPPPPGADLAIDLGGGRSIELEVHSLAHASPSRVRSQLARSRHGPSSNRFVVLVADAIPATTRRLLEDAAWGWLDRRGHLRLRAPGLHVDTDVTPASRRDSGPGAPISGQAGIATAVELLMRPGDAVRVRATAERARLHPSSISRALKRLREHSLVHGDGTALLPELFWALADVWAVEGQFIKREPRLSDARQATLQFNTHALDEPGWALGGTRAAVAWGAPLVANATYPPDFIVPDDATLRRSRQRYGDATTPRSAAAVIRVAPTLLAVRHRVLRAGEEFPLAHPVVVALDLASDISRGIETLEKWTPPPPFDRVW